MTKPKLLNEWLFAITAPAGDGRSRVHVNVENVDAKDRAFVAALARVAEVWLRARRPA